MRRGLFRVNLMPGLLLAFFLSPSVQAGYWQNQFDLPVQSEKEPAGAEDPRFAGEEGLHVLTVFQIMTDLGRKQTIQIDQLNQESGTPVVCYSTDRVAQKWPRTYIQDFLREKKVSLPLYSASDKDLRGLFRGYDTGKMRVFPHTLISDASRSIRQILRGFQSKEKLIEALAYAEDPWSGIDFQENTTTGNILVNGDFESGDLEGVPEGWGAYQPDEGTVLASSDTGWNRSTSLEIRSSKERDYQIAYQITPHTDLLGRKINLEGLALSNSLGLPRVALAIPHPRVDKGFDFVPRTPLTTRSGKGIPLRIIGSLDFETDHSHWQRLATEVTIPQDARALVLVMYLDNPEATGGAARFDEVRITTR